MQVGELLSEIRHPVTKGSRLLLGIHRGMLGPVGLGRRPAGACLGFGAELLEQPDPLDKPLTFRLIHVSTSCHRRGSGAVNTV